MPSAAAAPAAAGARLADVQKQQNNVKAAAHAMIDGRFIVIRPPLSVRRSSKPPSSNYILNVSGPAGPQNTAFL
jgi:hypothetical protein